MKRPGCFLLSLVLAIMGSRESMAQAKPNVLLIAIDDLNDWVGYLNGHPQVQTPNMDRLSKMGVSFSNAHAQAPLCNPSRTSFLTGLRPTTTGIYALDTWIRNVEGYQEVVTLPQYFERHGYQTLTTGKVFHDAYPPKESRRDGPEFSTWGFKGGFNPRPDEPFVKNSGHPLIDWGIYPEQDSLQDDWKVAEWAIHQLKHPPKNKPFFLSVGFRHPHVPLYASQQWFDLYADTEHLLPTVLGTDRDDIPPFAWYLHWYLPEPRLAWLKMNHEWRNKVIAYLASVSFVDMLVGRLLDALHSEELLENTIIVLLSDHGYHLGSKDISGKNSLWHESTRVPLIVAGPRVLEKGKISDQPVELLDIYPTLLDLAGLPSHEEVEGQSLLPMVQDIQAESRKPAICTHGPDNHAIITNRWRFIQYADGSQELYDRLDDPYEWDNLLLEDGYDPIVEELSQFLPRSSPPVSKNKVRLVERIDGKPYWQGKPIEKGDPIPMEFKN